MGARGVRDRDAESRTPVLSLALPGLTNVMATILTLAPPSARGDEILSPLSSLDRGAWQSTILVMALKPPSSG
jgi:hypothetical protein